MRISLLPAMTLVVLGGLVCASQPVMAGDVRLDFYFGSDHTFSHGDEMLAAKIELLERDLEVVLPELARELGISTK